MNCSQVEKLLPLFAGHDLDEERIRSINEHLQMCARCAGTATEYHDTRQLLEESAPAFAEDVYREIRQSVWRRIEAESKPQSLSEMFAGWFRPGLVWAVATTLLIVVSVAIYLNGKRMSVREPVAAGTPKTNFEPKEGGGRSGNDEREAVTSPVDRGSNKHLKDARQYQRKFDRQTASYQVNALAVRSPDAQPSKVEAPAPVDASGGADVAVRDAEKTLRMEIQTRNPNIRIIWFARQDAKPASPNSKGI